MEHWSIERMLAFGELLTSASPPQWKGIMPIDKPYAYHKPSDEGQRKINILREHFSETERLIKEICGTNRQSAIAITNNEQTAMWAIKSIVFNDPGSEVE